MPWIAIHNDEKKGAWQVPSKTDAKCPECGGTVRVWRESSHGTARHFKHIGNMGGNGGKGPSDACKSVAESDEHLKWKNFAAEKIFEEFEDIAESCQVEKGLKAPKSDNVRRVGDVVLLFKERDPQLGKGIVVEVQHKNNSKNIEATTEDYIAQDLAVAWLDSNDFSDTHCRLSEVDFRKKAFQAVWPKAVRPASQWGGNTYKNTYRKKWRRAWNSGLVESGAPATLPPEWCDKKSLEIWRNRPWYQLFQDARLSPRATTGDDTITEYKHEKFIKSEIGVTKQGPTSIWLPPEWHDEVARELWERQPWESLFSSIKSQRLNALDFEYQYQSYLHEVRDTLISSHGEWTMEVNVPIGKWMSSESIPDPILRTLAIAYNKGRNRHESGIVKVCPHCGTTEIHDPIHQGELTRGTMCGNCREWYVVADNR